MIEEPEKDVEEMEEREKELDRQIEQTEEGWEKTQREVPSADDDEPKPLDEDNPVGGP